MTVKRHIKRIDCFSDGPLGRNFKIVLNDDSELSLALEFAHYPGSRDDYAATTISFVNAIEFTLDGKSVSCKEFEPITTIKEIKL